MSIQTSRTKSILIITIIYIAAFFVGWLTYRIPCLQALHYLWRMFAADVAATIFVWIFGLAYRNVSVYDPYWSVAPPVMLTCWAIATGHGNGSVILVLLAIWAWAIRLTGNWVYTFHGLGSEDWRYTKYRTSQHPFIFQVINFFGLNMMPTIVVFLAMVPAFKIIDGNASANIWTIVTCCMCMGCATLQWFADHQIHQFIKAKKGRVCNIGLWKNGRHPNYFGEIMMWWSIYLMFLSVTPDISSTWWWLIGAVLNTCLFCFISVPLMENRQLRNKPEYAEYKKSTRMFI